MAPMFPAARAPLAQIMVKQPKGLFVIPMKTPPFHEFPQRFSENCFPSKTSGDSHLVAPCIAQGLWPKMCPKIWTPNLQKNIKFSSRWPFFTHMPIMLSWIYRYHIQHPIVFRYPRGYPHHIPFCSKLNPRV